MPTYLWHVSYTPQGAKGLLKDGGSKRRTMVQQMIEKVGGRLLAFYYAFGKSDLYCIAEFPDHATATAVSLVVNAAGAAQVHTTVLLAPEEIDAATKKTVNYQPPGA